MSNLEKTYEPKQVEDKWYAIWEENKCFAAEDESDKEPYCIVIPPPNVTGKLHIGHALNNTLQDVLIRMKRMDGFNACWVPGTDHAGIATQNMVEKKLREEGTTKSEIGRETFLERVWQWKEEYGGTITHQLRKLGCSCDWDRERFTMDEGLSEAVAEVFCKLYEDDLIYQGDYIINWSPALKTALSDDEVEPKEVNGKFYYIKYPVVGGKQNETILVATTRPETLLGDVAVAVNPRDKRYEDLDKKTIVLPFLDRELQVIRDDYVDPEFGTGIVKITPAHDPNDFDMGTRHNLTPINVMNEDGTMNEAAGPYAGMDRFEARKKIVADLDKLGFIEKIEDHVHNVGHCYRSGCIIEPRLSKQWFVKMKPLARQAIECIEDGSLEFVPDRWTKTYMNWMEGIRDWCISRQLWWGHQIPVYTCTACSHQWAERTTPEKCVSCGDLSIEQDPDVLDTWFSSWLWPMSVHGWPNETKALETFFPSQTLVTAPDIIFFWVARMVMSGKQFMGKSPFSRVYLHGVVRDRESGLKQSKSLGNAVDPLEIIEDYSADALRYCIIRMNATGKDIYLDKEIFEIGRNFSTKIWNSARFMQMHAEGAPENFQSSDFDPALLSPDDKHLLYHLSRTIEKCSEHLERFRFNDYASEIYDFIWHKYCDWYVEYSKKTLYGEDQARKDTVLRVMHYAFSNAIKLLHPMMPFITEELWEKMGYKTDSEYIMLADWPKSLDDEQQDHLGLTDEIVDYVEAKHEIIQKGRQLRSNYDISPAKKIDYIIKPAEAQFAEALTADLVSIGALLRAENLVIDSDFEAKKTPSEVGRIGNIYMPIEDLIDIDAEIEKLKTQLAKHSSLVASIAKKLENPGFTNNAPKDVVDDQRKRKEELLETITKTEKLIAELADGNA